MSNVDYKKKARGGGGGPDDMPNAFLKGYPEWRAKYLCIIFNKSLSIISMPAKWEMEKVIPVHKRGSEADTSNFKPIFLTSATCKLLELIILKHTTFLANERIFSPFQHDIRQGMSLVTQLFELFNNLS